MLIEHEEFDEHTGPPSNSQDETVYRYCGFAELTIEGSGFDGVLIDCTLRKIDWYWGLFNVAIFARSRFENCTFRGSSFMSCQLFDCHFSGCQFAVDNLKGPCRFEDCSIVECTFDKCEFVIDNPHGRPVFTRTRWYGCTQTQCTGLAGVF